MPTSILRKVFAFSAATAVGILGAALFCKIVAELTGNPLQPFPFWAIAKVDWMLAAVAVAPWLFIERSRSYLPIWLSSLFVGGGFGVLCGAMAALLLLDWQNYDLLVMFFAGLGTASALAASSFAQATGLFGKPRTLGLA